MTVEQHLEKIRLSLGISRADFADLTVRQLQEAQARTTWCAVHGSVRNVKCGWCGYLSRVERVCGP